MGGVRDDPRGRISVVAQPDHWFAGRVAGVRETNSDAGYFLSPDDPGIYDGSRGHGGDYGDSRPRAHDGSADVGGERGTGNGLLPRFLVTFMADSPRQLAADCRQDRYCIIWSW